jgi:hypothetical protein
MNYLQRNIEIVGSIDPSELGRAKAENCIGQNEGTLSGSPTLVYALGSFATEHGTVHLALKRVGSPGNRLYGELKDTLILDKRTPELVAQLPRFIGTVSVEGDNKPAAIITEDASAGGRLKVRQANLSAGSLAIFSENFEDFGGLEAFDHTTLIHHTTFEVDGRERILDLQPSIFFGSEFAHPGNQEYIDAMDNASRATDKLDIKIKADSPLAGSLL